ncbi:hypothetical protein ACYUJ6_02055 [Clostridium sp. JNZ X4-2]
MANRRIFSLDVVDTDKFLELPATSQSLYFHLGMRADDDGFVSSPKKIANMVNCSIDDLKLLIAKNYLIPFNNGVVVITDWKVNNWVRPDRKRNTRFAKELSMLHLEDDVYKLTTKCQPNVNQLTTECHTEDRLGKDRLGKVNNTISKDIVSSAEVQQIIEKWNQLGLSKVVTINNNTNRYKMLKARIKEYSINKIFQAIENINNSSFLKGQNENGWTITFDWLIKPNNFIKVLENNYIDKRKSNDSIEDLKNF